jgi:GntR family transcriptional repressor for pyruvate dehydrogenase complex
MEDINNVSGSRQAFNPISTRQVKPLAEQIADKINQLIIDRDLHTGDKLPNEFELASSLHVGRGTVREAIKLLVARNCLEIQRGKGTFVAQNIGIVDDPLGFAYVSDQLALSKDLIAIRLHMEPWICKLAAEQIHDDEKTELKKRCAAVTEKILAREDHRDADVRFHQYIAECTHNTVMPELIPIITYTVSIFTRFRDQDLLDETIETHQGITDAIIQRNGDKAAIIMKDHILANVDSLIRTAVDQGNSALAEELRAKYKRLN